MKNKIIASFVIASLFALQSYAQSLAINTDGSSASASALLDVKSTTRGMLIPRMTKSEKTLIASPATGLLVFQNGPDSVGFHYFDGSNWVWLVNSSAIEDWHTTGNSGVTSTNFLGTNNSADLRFIANTSERGRISYNSGFWGYGEVNPQYNIDVSLGNASIFPCSRNGIRLKPVGMSNICDNGFFMGLDNNNSITDASIWNYGNNGSGAQNLRLGMNGNEIARFNNWAFMGLGETSPQYNLDMKLGSAFVNPCTRNGMRINILGNSNACDKGLFVGYDDNSAFTTASLWNFGDGSNGNSLLLRFGLGGDFTNGEKMRITSEGVGIGFGSVTQLAKLQIIYNSGFALPGVMVINPSTPGSMGFYSGLKTIGASTRGRVWNFMNDGIEFGSNDQERMIISGTGNVGIGTSPGFATPNSTLQVDGTVSVGVSMNLAGGTSGTATALGNYKSYIGLSPSPGSEYYKLPDPTTCTGRIYYIRNNDNSNSAWVGTAAGLLCPGNFTCLAPGTFYELKGNISVKTVIVISDGANWTIGRID